MLQNLWRNILLYTCQNQFMHAMMLTDAVYHNSSFRTSGRGSNGCWQGDWSLRQKTKLQFIFFAEKTSSWHFQYGDVQTFAAFLLRKHDKKQTKWVFSVFCLSSSDFLLSWTFDPFLVDVYLDQRRREQKQNPLLHAIFPVLFSC